MCQQITNEILQLKNQLKSLDLKKEELIRRINLLENELTSKTDSAIKEVGASLFDKTPVTSQEKVQLFLRLFRCRQTVYPKLWENKKTGLKGYSPACKNEWHPTLCQKPKIKCTDCLHQSFFPLDEAAVEAHLRGNHTIGTYAILEDDTCTFLASDFDGGQWFNEVIAYKNAASSLGIEVIIERSRSGQGAHAWIFFESPIPAYLARQLGTLIITQAMASLVSMKMDSYDRFFPNQDILPKGGFGNLIALPLQKEAREKGNSIFIDKEGIPYPNQWQYLGPADAGLFFMELSRKRV